MNKELPLKLGLIGYGGFGRFCSEIYAGLEQIHLIAVADIDPNARENAARKFNVAVYADPKQLIETADIDIVHISTPPDTHFPLGIQALEAGKHVICEKPLALSLDAADKMLRSARQGNLILPVNFILRYVPIVEMVKKIIQSKLLGEALHASFENYAADEKLGEDHWFWDQEKSGGIFVEHAVHFFDLYDYWFGDGEVIYAHAEVRPGTAQEDRVFCLLRHPSEVLANHYHGFDQPLCLDRATHRILFETGDVTIQGWIPESLTLTAIVDEEKAVALKKICPGSDATVLETFDGSRRNMRGRGKSIRASSRLQLHYQAPFDKQKLYANAVKNLIQDQIAVVRNPQHQRIVMEENGRRALMLALQASRLKRNI